MNLDEKLVEKVIKEGHAIADKIRNAKTLDEVEKLSSEIEEYSDFVNENFGVLDDFGEDGEKYCELAFYIHMAAKEKTRQLEYYPNETEAGNEDVSDFEYYLDSKAWTRSIKNAEF